MAEDEGFHYLYGNVGADLGLDDDGDHYLYGNVGVDLTLDDDGDHYLYGTAAEYVGSLFAVETATGSVMGRTWVAEPNAEHEPRWVPAQIAWWDGVNWTNVPDGVVGL